MDARALTREELQHQLEAWGQPVYRLDQLLDWLHAKTAASWDEMSNLPRELRRRLAAQYELHLPQIVQVQGARDTTRKFLWRLSDGALIESVLIPANPALYGEASDRHTLCISTQVGCAYGCRFCASGLDGWKRNLLVEEIVGQVLAVERWRVKEKADGRLPGEESGEADDGGRITEGGKGRRLINNLVVMGMGEPLANYDHLVRALGLLNAPWGYGIGARKITVSTSGLAPQIRRLAAHPQQYGLAISLHGATDDVRNRLMPINRKYPLAELMAACETFVQAKGRMITFEYILIEGVNDDPAQTRPLAALARRLHAKVNLIPYNTVAGLPWRRPSDRALEAFLGALEAVGVQATLRREKGHDIDAACGQLRLRTEREFRAP
jgi:23S rRNA (adenine2503-C2)-methyltransferase